MSNRSVSIIQINNLWFFGDFTQTPSGWDIARVKFAGTDKDQAISRAISSATSRALPFTEINFSPTENDRLLHQLQSKTAYRKAAKRFCPHTLERKTHQSKTKKQHTSATTLKSDADAQPAPLLTPQGQAVNPTTDGHTVTVYFDGSSHGNPGISGAAAVIDLPTGESFVFSEFIPSANASFAEYSAALLGLRKTLELGYKSILLKGDSQEVIFHLLDLKISPKKQGKHLDPLHEEAFTLLRQFESAQIEWLPRKQNHRADSAVRKIILAFQSKSQASTPKVSSTSNAPKNKNKKQKTVKLNAAIDLLYRLSLPTMPPSPHLADHINRMTQLGKKARVSDYETLKSGWDEFSSKRLPTLMALLPDIIKSAITDTLTDVKPQVKPEDLAKVYRWILRGLPAFMAVRKIEVDANTKRQVIKALRRL